MNISGKKGGIKANHFFMKNIFDKTDISVRDGMPNTN
jgi:hypothetical protein